MSRRLTVVLSQGQSNSPDKRALEETLIKLLVAAGDMDVVVIPHLYDLAPEGASLSTLRAIDGDFVLLAWLHPRAAHWTLDQFAVPGRLAVAQSRSNDEPRVQEGAAPAWDEHPDPAAERAREIRTVPDRTIYHFDLRVWGDATEVVQEIQHLAAAASTAPTQLPVEGPGSSRKILQQASSQAKQPTVIQEVTRRRWYPVIDYSRCTNCMECIDFCLFGVYGLDAWEAILVEQPDNCRKGCPACSRVCPEHAIMFPQHKSPGIAGDPSAEGGLKVDLSQLFGKPSEIDLASRERDEYLRLAEETGGAAEPAPTGEPQRVSGPRDARRDEQQDELDDLIDQLDRLDL